MTIREERLLQIGDGLAVLANQVKETWRAEDYPVAVRSDFAQFRHAHAHIVKSVGKIAALIDHVEHDRVDEEAMDAAAELPKLIADLVRCSAKMAEAWGINFAKAYMDRADQLARRWGH